MTDWFLHFGFVITEIDQLYEKKRQLVGEFKKLEREYQDARDKAYKKQRQESFKKREEERRAQQQAYQKDIYM